VRHSPDGKLLAAGCGDGAIRIYEKSSGELKYNLNVESKNQLPTTSIRFRPSSGRSKTKNVLLAVNADGSLDHWHVTSRRKIHTVEEKDNQLLCVDYRYDGGQFATAGKDYSVRIYDEATKTKVAELAQSFGTGHGHSNRVFSLKYQPQSSNIVVSGGWDNTVQIWDLRVKSSVRSIFGPHIAGDSVDICGDTILTGSWRPENVLQTWDLGTGKLFKTIQWDENQSKASCCKLYTAQFSPSMTRPAKFICAGGSGSNEARIFETSKGNALVGVIKGFEKAVYTSDFSPCDNTVAIAGGDSKIHIFSISERRFDSSKMDAKEYTDSVYVSV